MTDSPAASSDLAFHFDERLRETPDDPARFALAVRALERRLTAEREDRARLRLLGRLGAHLRTLGALEEAEARLLEAVALADRLADGRAALTNRIRLAHVYQWQRRFAEADALFRGVIAACEGAPDHVAILPFGYQHYGKRLFDQGRYAEAADLFARALAMRGAAGDEGLVASSRLALDAARARLR